MAAFPKPLVCAVNGMGLGFGATVLGFADLAFMADTARLKCPFTRLGVAPEAASSYLFPLIAGRQKASWMLLSSEWVDAATCVDMGLALRACPADELMAVATEHAAVLAAKPISSLVASKAVIVDAHREQVAAARASKAAYGEALARAGYGPITTEILPAPPFYFAEDYHQQYLAKNPGGYCGLGGTGVGCPAGVEGIAKAG